MSKQEKIVCAAIYVMSVKDGYEGTHIVKGVNYEEINKDGLLPEISHPTFCNMLIRGFVTNKNRFVDPVRAMKIAIDADQVLKLSKLGEEWHVMALEENRGHELIDLACEYEELKKEYLSKELKPEDLY